MRSDRSQGQLLLFPDAGGRAQRASAPARRRPPSPGRNARMAARLERAAAEEDREAIACLRAGDEIGARAARDRAADARRAAALLRAGPSGVGRLLAS